MSRHNKMVANWLPYHIPPPGTCHTEEAVSGILANSYLPRGEEGGGAIYKSHPTIEHTRIDQQQSATLSM